MKALFKTTLVAALIAGSAASASAQMTIDGAPETFETYQTAERVSTSMSPSKLSPGTTIAVARLDGGRLIPTPYAETEDWTFLDRRIDTNIVQLGAAAYIKYTPELPLDAAQPVNKLDEVRLTAANEGFEYVLIYGVGLDARWASFGGMSLPESGLTVKPDCASWEQAKAKALLVNSFTGDVLGAATADNIEFNIGALADDVEDMIEALRTPQYEDAVISPVLLKDI